MFLLLLLQRIVTENTNKLAFNEPSFVLENFYFTRVIYGVTFIILSALLLAPTSKLLSTQLKVATILGIYLFSNQMLIQFVEIFIPAFYLNIAVVSAVAFLLFMHKEFEGIFGGISFGYPAGYTIMLMLSTSSSIKVFAYISFFTLVEFVLHKVSYPVYKILLRSIVSGFSLIIGVDCIAGIFLKPIYSGSKFGLLPKIMILLIYTATLGIVIFSNRAQEPEKLESKEIKEELKEEIKEELEKV